MGGQGIGTDPKLVEARELMANLALEDSDRTEALKQADAALQMSPEALGAMAVHAAVEVLSDRSPDAWLAKIHQVNPSYGEAARLSPTTCCSTTASMRPWPITARRLNSIRSFGRRVPPWA